MSCLAASIKSADMHHTGQLYFNAVVNFWGSSKVSTDYERFRLVSQKIDNLSQTREFLKPNCVQTVLKSWPRKNSLTMCEHQNLVLSLECWIYPVHICFPQCRTCFFLFKGTVFGNEFTEQEQKWFPIKKNIYIRVGRKLEFPMGDQNL